MRGRPRGDANQRVAGRDRLVILSEAKDQRSEASRSPASQTLRCAQGDTLWQLKLTLMGLTLPRRDESRSYAYSYAKQPFIWQVIAQADEWVQLTSWMPGPSDA